MGLTSALYTTLTGLNANQQRLDVIGNNIANVNTNGYKSTSIDFQTMFSQTLSSGSPPSANNGGTNPVQIGLGTQTGATTRNFTDGSRNSTGVNTNLAIQGNGFFVLQGNQQTFTRDGSFTLNAQNQLVSSNGDFVQGYGVDANYNVVPGPLSNITIPLGTLTVAEATTEVTINGSLNATGALPTTLSNISMQNPLFLAGAGSTPSATAPAATDLLTNIVDITNVPIFLAGDTLNVGGTRGSASDAVTISPKSMTITSTTTMQDYLDFISGTLGIDTAAGANGTLADGGAQLTTVSPATAVFPANSRQMVIIGNVGKSNNLTIGSADITIARASGSTPMRFGFDINATADGESTATSMTIYDSLGSPVDVNVNLSMVSRDSTGTDWQYIVTSPDSTTGQATGGVGTNTFISSGSMHFDNNGKLVGGVPSPTITIDRSNTGASPLLQFGMGFTAIKSLSGGDSGASGVYVSTVNGSEKGTLTNFTIAENGTIIGSFDKGAQRNLGQVVLATFANNQGLLDNGNNTFVPGASSGLANISTPGQLAAGTIVNNSLELSNVDLSKEFVNLISASTGFSASSRVITTSNQLLQELLQSAR